MSERYHYTLENPDVYYEKIPSGDEYTTTTGTMAGLAVKYFMFAGLLGGLPAGSEAMVNTLDAALVTVQAGDELKIKH
jgi:hypothetical protein